MKDKKLKKHMKRQLKAQRVTIREVELAIDLIREAQPDATMVQSRTMALFRLVLSNIESGHPEPAMLAAAALRVEDINFPSFEGVAP